jgi:hypothetical protein
LDQVRSADVTRADVAQNHSRRVADTRGRRAARGRVKQRSKEFRQRVEGSMAEIEDDLESVVLDLPIVKATNVIG